MRLSNETIAILKNFVLINESIYFRKGDVISTISPLSNVYADAKISETFPVDFCIFDLNNFLAVLSMFKDGAELEFNDKHVVIKGFGGRSKVNYRFTEPSMIVVAPEKGPTLPSVDVKFTLTENDYNWIIKSANILNSPNVGIVSDGNDVCVSIFDENDDSAHTNSVVLPNVETNGKKFKFVFKTMYLKFIPGDYVVEIYLKDSMGAAKFVENKLNLRYFTAIEKSSWIDS